MPLTLPPAVLDHGNSLVQTIAARRSCREYSNQPVDLESLSMLLWSAQGVTGDGKRVAPSAGAQYPMQVFVATGRVDGLAPGSYRYLPEAHQLQPVLDGDLRDCLGNAALDQQPWVGDAALVLLICADLESMKIHFQDQPPKGMRGERYVYLESGAIAQNVQLLSQALQLGAVLVGGFDDVKVGEILRLPDSFQPTAMICIGAR